MSQYMTVAVEFNDGGTEVIRCAGSIYVQDGVLYVHDQGQLPGTKKCYPLTSIKKWSQQ